MPPAKAVVEIVSGGCPLSVVPSSTSIVAALPPQPHEKSVDGAPTLE